MKTFSPKPEQIERRWYVVDAEDQVLGRLASHVASVLRGKHKPIYAPHVDAGDHVVVVNASKVRLTGNKLGSKIYYRHSQFPGGLREIDYERLLATRPELAVEKAVRGMLPKNRLGRQIGRKLVVYAGAEHRQQAQKPRPLTVGDLPEWTGLPEPKPAPKREPSGRDAAAGPGRKKAASSRGKAAPKKRAAKKTAARPTKGAAKKATARRGGKKAAAGGTKASPKRSAKRTARKKTEGS